MKSFFQNTSNVYLSLVLLAGLLYVNTLGHGFVLDDEAVILKNQFVRQGTDGIKDIFLHDSFSGFESAGGGQSILEGGRYRPLSLVFFALIFSFSGENAFPFHLFNVVLYIVTGLLVFRVLEVMLKDISEPKWISLLTSTLFVVHPAHTEVVANIKSADELLSFLFGLLFLLSLLHWFDKKKSIYLWLSPALLFLACLSKESAITLVVTGPLAIWYFRKADVKKILVLIIPSLIAAIVYLLVRHQILGDQLSGTIMHDPMNNPFLEWNGNAWVQCEPLVKVATLLYVFAKYVWLMLIPFPLTHDYYPFHIALQSFANPMVWIGLIMLILMSYYGIKSLGKKQIAGYGILFFLISLVPVANLFFPVGTFMAERFLYLSSFGFILAITATAIQRVTEQNRRWLWWTTSTLIILFTIITIKRNGAWNSNETLMLTDVKVAPNSAKLQLGAGTILLNKALQQPVPTEQKKLLQEALPHLQKSIELHPTYYDAHLAYGACTYYLQMYDESVSAYRKMSEQHPNEQKTLTGLRYALEASGRDKLMKGDTASSILALQEAWDIYPDSLIASQLSMIYIDLHQLDSSKVWFDRAQHPTR
ncbi:MAG TPA: hypothetical protein VGK46_14625 [Saprospiraceae bacterium]